MKKREKFELLNLDFYPEKLLMLTLRIMKNLKELNSEDRKKEVSSRLIKKIILISPLEVLIEYGFDFDPEEKAEEFVSFVGRYKELVLGAVYKTNLKWFYDMFPCANFIVNGCRFDRPNAERNFLVTSIFMVENSEEVIIDLKVSKKLKK